jgi:hypothetical protein
MGASAWVAAVVTEYEKHRSEQGGLRPLCRAVANALEIAEQHRRQPDAGDAPKLVAAAFREDGR